MASLIPRFWFRAGSVNIRQTDFSTCLSAPKSWMYQDILEKPAELTMFRKTENGGLGLVHIGVRRGHRVNWSGHSWRLWSTRGTNTACFMNSSTRSWPGADVDLIDTPYYSREFFADIKTIKDNTAGMNIAVISLKEIYRTLFGPGKRGGSATGTQAQSARAKLALQGIMGTSNLSYVQFSYYIMSLQQHLVGKL